MAIHQIADENSISVPILTCHKLQRDYNNLRKYRGNAYDQTYLNLIIKHHTALETRLRQLDEDGLGKSLLSNQIWAYDIPNFERDRADSLLKSM